MKNFSRALGFVGLVLSLATASAARAELYANALFGLTAAPSKSPMSNRFGYGFDIGWKPIPEFGFGGYYLTSTGDFDSAPVSAQLEFYGGEITFYLPFTGLSLGARVGSNMLSPSYPGAATSSNELSAGPKLGWDTPLTILPVSVGVEYNPMFLFTGGSGHGGYTVHHLNAVVGMRF